MDNATDSVIFSAGVAAGGAFRIGSANAIKDIDGAAAGKSMAMDKAPTLTSNGTGIMVCNFNSGRVKRSAFAYGISNGACGNVVSTEGSSRNGGRGYRGKRRCDPMVGVCETLRFSFGSASIFGG